MKTPQCNCHESEPKIKIYLDAFLNKYKHIFPIDQKNTLKIKNFLNLIS